MIDYTLRECPFCGNPAEIVEDEPFSWWPKEPTMKIRCSSGWCILHHTNSRFLPEGQQSARAMWNTRKRKNKLTWADADKENKE